MVGTQAKEESVNSSYIVQEDICLQDVQFIGCSWENLSVHMVNTGIDGVSYVAWALY